MAVYCTPLSQDLSSIINYSRHPLKWIETLLDRSHPSMLDFGNRIFTVSLEDGGQDVLELVFNHVDRLRMFNLQNKKFINLFLNNRSSPKKIGSVRVGPRATGLWPCPWTVVKASCPRDHFS